MSTIVAYVDGSYNKNIHQCSYAAVFLDEKEENVIDQAGGLIDDLNYCNMRNIGGEIISASFAILYAVDKGYTDLIIYYDYKGIYEWVRGDIHEWDANNDCTKNYKALCKDISKVINISFIKIKSHSENKYNDMVDKLAKDYALIKEKARIPKSLAIAC